MPMSHQALLVVGELDAIRREWLEGKMSTNQYDRVTAYVLRRRLQSTRYHVVKGLNEAQSLFYIKRSFYERSDGVVVLYYSITAKGVSLIKQLHGSIQWSNAVAWQKDVSEKALRRRLDKQQHRLESLLEELES